MWKGRKYFSRPIGSPYLIAVLSHGFCQCKACNPQYSIVCLCVCSSGTPLLCFTSGKPGWGQPQMNICCFVTFCQRVYTHVSTLQEEMPVNQRHRPHAIKLKKMNQRKRELRQTVPDPLLDTFFWNERRLKHSPGRNSKIMKERNCRKMLHPPPSPRALDASSFPGGDCSSTKGDSSWNGRVGICR